MKNVLSLKLGQSLSMTPALQQAIRLLQMASLDLQTEIQQALDSNLMLEPEEAETEVDAPERAADEEPAPAQDTSEELKQTNDHPETIPDDPGEDFSWNDVYSGSGDDPEAQQALQDYRQASMTSTPDLQDHLLNQARLLPLDPVQRSACAYLIDGLDERGYIRDYPELRDTICADCGLSTAEVDAVLAELQSCDPIGVAARDLRECLQLQLLGLPACPERDIAQKIVSQHLQDITQVPLRSLSKRLQAEEDQVDLALHLIRSLQPHPGAPFQDHANQYVSPDLFVRKRSGRWEALLNPEIAPKIRINSTYQSYLKRGDGSPEQQTLKNHLAEARHFLHALRSRNETLLRVGQEIVDLQRGFLEYGPEAMKPLVLRDIADRLGLHESTVSRATASKYMHTPRGLFELKYFFSSSVGTTEGGSCSATAIQAMIKRFVSAENPAKPLSDSRLVQMLHDEGVQVARRTVAKYRDTLGIPPTHERRVRA